MGSWGLAQESVPKNYGQKQGERHLKTHKGLRPATQAHAHKGSPSDSPPPLSHAPPGQCGGEEALDTGPPTPKPLAR